MERDGVEYVWRDDDNKDVGIEIFHSRGAYTAIKDVPQEMGAGSNGNLTQRIIGQSSNKRDFQSGTVRWMRQHPTLASVMQYLRTKRLIRWVKKL